ncbi:MAG TPA: hypothetical protein DC017_16365 [Candidatus Wallbacteria bacterium]|nr:hypothetical protein [Candidatus Wallbacteria bacterium]
MKGGFKMNGCDKAFELIEKAASEDITPEEKVLLNSHISGCADCAAQYADIIKIEGYLAGSLAPLTVPKNIDKPEVFMKDNKGISGILFQPKYVFAALAAVLVLFLIFFPKDIRKKTDVVEGGGSISWLADYELSSAVKNVYLQREMDDVKGRSENFNGTLSDKKFIITDDFGSAELKYKGSSSLKLKPGTQLEAGVNNVRLKKGGIWVSYKNNGVAFSVKTPTATIGIKGTRFKVEVSDDGKTKVALYEGKISIENSFGKSEMNPGDEAEAQASAAPVIRKAVSNEDEEMFIKNK